MVEAASCQRPRQCSLCAVLADVARTVATGRASAYGASSTAHACKPIGQGYSFWVPSFAPASKRVKSKIKSNGGCRRFSDHCCEICTVSHAGSFLEKLGMGLAR